MTTIPRCLAIFICVVSSSSLASSNDSESLVNHEFDSAYENAAETTVEPEELKRAKEKCLILKLPKGRLTAKRIDCFISLQKLNKVEENQKGLCVLINTGVCDMIKNGNYHEVTYDIKDKINNELLN